MIYRVKEKFWSLGNNFTITDEAGLNCYRVTGKAFSWGDKLSFQAMEGKELAFIKQKMMSLMRFVTKKKRRSCEESLACVACLASLARLARLLSLLSLVFLLSFNNSPRN